MNVGDIKGVKAQEQAIKLKREIELDDLQAVLSTASGRRFVWRLIEQAGPLQEAFTGNSTTFYILGKQAFGRRILELILSEFPDLFVIMQKEAKERQQKEE